MAQRTPLNIAVVGHTNTGKTSLLRTLTRDTQFGLVDNAPGTTRQVTEAAHWLHDVIALVWFDTPGLEDSVALFDWVESPEPQTPLASHGSTRLDGPQKIQRFLESPSAHHRFEQEARVLEKVLSSDAALYVIDARDPVLAKHRDELSLLSSCAKPVIAVLNFTAPTLDGRASNVEEWLNALARQAVHVHVLFDTVSPALDAERDLFEALTQVLPKHRALFTDLIKQTEIARHARRTRAFELIADMMIDLAAWRLPTANNDTAITKAQHTQHARTRLREQQCIDGLLLAYAFNRHDVLNMPLTMTDGRWQTDLFSPEALREVGIELSKGAAAGALAGAAVDVMTGGLSLGTGTLIGAATGAGWQGLERWGGRLLGRVRGYRELTLDDSILKLLAIRQLKLLQALDRRGHASITPVSVQNQQHENVTIPPNIPNTPNSLGTDVASHTQTVIAAQSKAFSQLLRLARQHPEWSSLQSQFNNSGARDKAVAALTENFESNAQLI